MTPKCRILCPTFGGHITLPKSRLLLCDVGGAVYWQHPLCLYYTPFPGLCQSLPAGAAGQFCKKPQGGDCHQQSFQKPKWSSIPRQCAHWHGICWMRGCFRRKRRNPASLDQVRAGRILKEGGASRSESNLTIAGGNRSLIISAWFAGANLSVPP